jgi:meiosis induction protein kinase IME2/SME1
MILQRLEQQRLQRLHEARISSIPTRSAPPPAISSNSPAYEKPAFSMGSESIRTLPPPVASPHTMSHNRSYHPSPERPSRYNSPVGASNSTSTSQTLLPSLSHNNGASALVESLRELDLPTADLSTYGHRSLSPGQHNKRPAPVPHQHGERRSSDLVALQSMSLATPEHGSQSSLNQSNSGHNTYPQAPPAAPTYQRSYLPPHMSTPTALMSGQTPRTPGSFDLYHHRGSGESLLPPAEETDVDMQDVSEPLPMAPSNKFIPHPYQPQPPREPPQQAVNSRLGDLAATGKKKKWGLSSVFGVGGNSHNESKADHGPPPAANIASSALNNASLKRPQSEVASADRSAVTQVNLNPGMDSKKNRKELDKQAKEQEKQLQAARRKAMEDAQKERARAVLAKRTQLVETRRVNGTQTNEIEWNTELSTIDSASMRTSNTSNTSIPAGHKSQSQQELMSRASSTPSNIGNLPSTSTPDLIPNQDLERRHREDSNPDAYRSKSRKMSAGDDHSLSGQAYRNTSSLTVGTTDSE